MDPKELAQREALRNSEREAAKAKPRQTTKTPKASEVEVSDFDWFTRPQYSVLRKALLKSSAVLVGQRRLDDGTLEYAAMDGDGKVIRHGTIGPDVDYPSR
jgi:hypothetical protein